MYQHPTEIQKQHYFYYSGVEYTEGKLEGEFFTINAYKKVHTSPWSFSYVFDQKTGYLVCQLKHRMTNNRVYGWDQNGKELNDINKVKYFKEYY